MNSDAVHYTEYSVTKKYEGAYGRKRILAILLYIFCPIVVSVLCLWWVGWIAVVWLVPLGVTFLAFVVRTTYSRFFRIEYDYRIAAGDLEIAEVYDKKARKVILTAKISDFETIAPYRDEYKTECEKGSYDRVIESVSSLKADHVYFGVYPDPDKPSSRTLVYFEPTTAMIRLISKFNRKTVVDELPF